MDRTAFVYIDIEEGPVLVGRLWSRIRKDKESATFEYAPGWLARPDRFALEPGLALTPGPFHTAQGKTLFGAIGDSAPDRWGRVLMRRAERRRADREGTAPRTLFEIDFLLNVDDEARAGALRFTETEGGPFLAEPGGRRIPALVDLPRLLSAADHVADDEDDDEDLRLLIAPGSSLGGARPKASVRDENGQLSIAKFPHKEDTINAVLWEATALSLARHAGIDVADWRVVPIADRAALLVSRFDRVGARRIPFLSAMSMLGATDNEREPRSYLEIADALRQSGASPNADLEQLWRRIVFNVLITNTDDHLRNHGFLYSGIEGWRLSPAYDLNPVPTDIKPRILSTAIGVDDPSASLDIAYENADYFGLKPARAHEIAGAVAAAVSRWREVAAAVGLSRRAIERMASAFEHEDLRKATGGAA
ncbi:MAG: HipA domain-containing protein [Devosia sp.]|nr:HipA domain-containing protein [Devosia sp.]